MSTKYVEDYRTNSSDRDCDVIQAAIDSLNDEDTLIFKRGGTYILDEPVYFTSYNETTSTGITRSFLTIDGNGCTICGSDTFNEVYGKITSENTDANYNSLFFISDIQKNGLTRSVIKNFNFNWMCPGSTLNETNYPYNGRNNAIGVRSCHESVYFHNGVIQNCRFYWFGTGIYMGGKDNAVEHCHFENCYIGINSDGEYHADIRFNHFVKTYYMGVNLNYSRFSNVYGNHFYKCEKAAISIIGVSESTITQKELAINVYSNQIFGGFPSNIDENTPYGQTGIRCNGVKDIVIRNNIIWDMCQQNENSTYGNNNGRGIDLYFNTNDGTRESNERVIIANNVIKNSKKMNIRVAYASSCIITGNSIHSGNLGEGNDNGIYVADTAGDIHISDNALYHFSEGKFIKENKYNINFHDNTYYDKNKKFDPMNPVRYITTSVSPDNSSVICIPKLSVPLENSEIFEMLIPTGYSSPTVTSITYNGLSGNVHDLNGNICAISSSNIGTYIKLRIEYKTSKFDENEKYLVFYMV